MVCGGSHQCPEWQWNTPNNLPAPLRLPDRPAQQWKELPIVQFKGERKGPVSSKVELTRAEANMLVASWSDKVPGKQPKGMQKGSQTSWEAKWMCWNIQRWWWCYEMAKEAVKHVRSSTWARWTRWQNSHTEQCPHLLRERQHTYLSHPCYFPSTSRQPIDYIDPPCCFQTGQKALWIWGMVPIIVMSA